MDLAANVQAWRRLVPSAIGLRAKIIAIASGVILLAFAAIIASSYFTFVREHGDALQSRSVAIATGMAVQLERLLALGLTVGELSGFEDQCREIVGTYDGLDAALVVNRNGMILFHSDTSRMGQTVTDISLLRALDGEPEELVLNSPEGNYSVLVPVFEPGNVHVASVVVEFSAGLLENQAREVAGSGLAVGLVVLAIGLLVLVAALSIFITRPLGRLVEAVERIDDEGMATIRPVEVSSRDEVGQLASAFNEMSRRLARAIARARLVAAVEARAAEHSHRSAQLATEIETRRAAEAELRKMLDRARVQMDIVGRVSQSEALLAGEVELLAREITELAGKASGCARVNAWLFNDEETELHCIDLYEATSDRHSAGGTLRESELGPEFQILKQLGYVDADDPLTDPRTAGYVESYVKPLGITAMLDVMVHFSGRNLGLLCFEHVGRSHQWQQDEIMFAIQLADKIGLAVVNRMRRQAEEALRNRDGILHAVTKCAAELVTTAALDETIPRILESMGIVIRADRMLVIEALEGEPHFAIRYAWHGSDAFLVVAPDFFATLEVNGGPDLGAWFAPLRSGQAVSTTYGEAEEPVRGLLDDLQIRSLLVVPIVVEGQFFGQLSIDDCQIERKWTPTEIDTLKTLADLIGAAIVRDRYVTKLSNANTVVRNSPAVLYRLEGRNGFAMTYVSENISLFGYRPVELTGGSHDLQRLVHPEDLGALISAMESVADRHASGGSISFRLRTASGDYRWVENRYAPVRDEQGDLIEIEGVIVDISERKAAEEHIAILARTDALTGLPNRVVFAEAVKHEIAQARRGHGTFAVLYLDLDHFKDINDTLGHPVGDELLKEVARRLQSTVREIDTVSRFGGDEFAVLQSGVNDPNEVGVLARKLLAAIERPFIWEGKELRPATSIGLAVYGPDSPDAEGLLSHADLALYRAKSEGRHTYRFFTDAMDIEVRTRFQLGNELREALASDQLFLQYQPQLDIESRRIIGVEALVRWNHPVHGVLMPGAFIPTAERSGLIIALGYWVLRAACRQAAEWRAAGIAVPVMAVNLSTLQLKAPRELERNLAAALAETGLPAAMLELELTETALMEVSHEHDGVLQRFREQGIRLAIDDFGTGYSSLDYLRRFPVDRIKIAQNFVFELTTNSGDAAIVQATISLARALGINVIAEGVEALEQAELLRSWGCREAQGFYYARPIDPAAMAPLLRAGWLPPATEQLMEQSSGAAS